MARDPLLHPNPAASAAQQEQGQGQAPGTEAGGSASGDVFLAVGLDSGITDFRRPRLNLAILLDVSGSMDAGLGGGYYHGSSGGAARSRDGGKRVRSRGTSPRGGCLCPSH